MAAPRETLAAALKPLLPKAWAIIDTGRSVDVLQKTTVQLFQRNIKRLPEAPIGKHFIGFLVEISAPEQGVARAEERLDEEVNDLIHALDTIGAGWTGAEKVSFQKSQRIGYQITLNVISSKE